MPKLTENLSSFLMNGIDDWLPGFSMLLRRNLGGTHPTRPEL
jgi:hypothetical protein